MIPTIECKPKNLTAFLSSFDPKKGEQAARLALTRTRDQGKTESVRLMSDIYNISKKDLTTKASGGERITVSGSIGTDLTAHIYFHSGGISLGYFGATEFKSIGNQRVRITRKQGKVIKRERQVPGVQVQTKRGGKTAKLKAFFAAVKYGKGAKEGYHMGVFSRHKGGGRLPIYERKMVSVATMICNPKVMKPLKTYCQNLYAERFDHEWRRLLGR